jgi:ankyrin repeat protein
MSLSLALGLIALLLLAWPLERRAFGEGSRPHFTRATTVLLFLSGTFFLSKMLLVILVEPPITRYVEAAAFLLPCVVALLYWDRSVVLAAALLQRPHWYNQCYAAYPAIPDTAHRLQWRAWAGTLATQRRAGTAIALTLILLILVATWTTRDTRLFRGLETHPQDLRPRLMTENPPVTWRAESGATVLHHAALQGDAELLAHLLEKDADPKATTNDGATALHWAAMSPHGDAVVPLLLATGLSTDTPGPQGLSPTHLAALFSNTATLQALLIGGARPGITNATGVTPLHLAGSIEVAATLLKSGAPLDAPDGTGATPFMWAHTAELARFLLERGANINARENWRSFVRECTPLTKASYQSDNDRARWLLEQGADPNAGDINNLSPIYYAIWRSNNPLLQMLLDRGADPNHPGHWTTYDQEYNSRQFTDLFAKTVGRHLMRESFPRLVPDKALMHPLDWAAFIGNTEAMDILLARGAHLEAHNAEGMSSLHWAMLGRQKKAEKMLRDRDPKLDLLDDARLPAGEFCASVEAGRRTMSAAPAPQAEGDNTPLPESNTATTTPPALPLP